MPNDAKFVAFGGEPLIMLGKIDIFVANGDFQVLLRYSHTSFYELPLYETSELRNRFLEVTASTKNQQIL